MELTSPYGGLVLIESNGINECTSKTITVEISGPVESPWFNLKTTNFNLNGFNSPWVELEGNNVHLTVPILSLKMLSEQNIKDSMKIWDQILKSHSELIRPICPYRKERIVPDTQISCGYMHSGYPIMTGYDICESKDNKLPIIFGLDQKANWGLMHELGHNFQRDYWCFDGTTEVTVNLFTLYTNYKVFGIDNNNANNHEAIAESKIKAIDYLKNPDYEVWKDDPFLALITYIQIIEEFGYDPLKKTLLEYELDIENGIKSPDTNQEKIETFVKKLSKHCGKDLRKHFIAWGIPYCDFEDDDLSNLSVFATK